MTATRPPHEVLSAFGVDGGLWIRIAPEGLHRSFAFHGDRGERLHMKQIRSPRSFEAVVAGLRNAQRLRSHGVPAPRIRLTHTGQLCARLDDDVWVLSEWIDGRQLEYTSPTVAADIGRVVARLHSGLNPAGLNERVWLASECWKESDATCDLVVKAHAALPEEIRNHVRWLAQHRPGDQCGAVSRTELVGSIFGDLWAGQFLFTEHASVCGLVDWDDAGTEGAIGEELAGLIFRSFLTDDGSVPFQGAAGSFIRAYQSGYPLPFETWHGVRDRMIVTGWHHLIHHIGAWLSDEPRTRVPIWRARIISRCRRLRWLVDSPAATGHRWAAELAKAALEVIG